MFAKLPMYQNIGASAYKEDISNIISICDHLDNPQNEHEIIKVLIYCSTIKNIIVVTR